MCFMRVSAIRYATTVGNTMRAWMTENYRGPLVCREVTIPSITQPNQVLIKVKVGFIIVIEFTTVIA
uniref:Uncharacterized protein n=1 Tax=Panagrolaimus superbus TaxID=310955 RepID=A0A914YUQ0_9BILA